MTVAGERKKGRQRFGSNQNSGEKRGRPRNLAAEEEATEKWNRAHGKKKKKKKLFFTKAQDKRPKKKNGRH